MNSVWKHFGACLFLGLLMVALGCSQPASDFPATYPVTGTVTLNGEPLSNANVTFRMVGEPGSAVGKTDASGKYSLMTFEPSDGALPGEYQVAFTQFEEIAPGEADPDVDDEAYAPPEGGAGETPVSENLLPAKFADPASSGFSATVTEGPNTFDFDLTE